MATKFNDPALQAKFEANMAKSRAAFEANAHELALMMNGDGETLVATFHIDGVSRSEITLEVPMAPHSWRMLRMDGRANAGLVLTRFRTGQRLHAVSTCGWLRPDGRFMCNGFEVVRNTTTTTVAWDEVTVAKAREYCDRVTMAKETSRW